ncbi:DUF1993 domain-containing protein [Caulobacter segnis]|uniref:DUF1993 domain-containing protein n=1 Tax=Caulobacter segnis TaxID=88688 RepID=UPI00240FEA9D|nr:DUF1993 domain-containing protein [Caulobacter segnis]MDG2523117.1 DUF1993 domain-containing protein [Caulobacter segnis]
MSLTMSQMTTPALVRGLRILSELLVKGEAWAEANGVDPAELTAARLFEDMASLTGQVQRVSDTAKFAIARLSGVDSPSMPDQEQTFADLHDRIAKTIAYIESVPASKIDGSESRTIQLKFPHAEFSTTGSAYLTGFVLPNFYFHLTTAYDILRHKGVPVGKRDYLGSWM